MGRLVHILTKSTSSFIPLNAMINFLKCCYDSDHCVPAVGSSFPTKLLIPTMCAFNCDPRMIPVLLDTGLYRHHHRLNQKGLPVNENAREHVCVRACVRHLVGIDVCEFEMKGNCSQSRRTGHGCILVLRHPSVHSVHFSS